MVPEGLKDSSEAKAFEATLEKVLRDVFKPLARVEELKRKPFLTSKEVEELYGIPASSLKTSRSKGGGPKCFRSLTNGYVRYTHDDIKIYLTSGQRGE